MKISESNNVALYAYSIHRQRLLRSQEDDETIVAIWNSLSDDARAAWYVAVSAVYDALEWSMWDADPLKYVDDACEKNLQERIRED